MDETHGTDPMSDSGDEADAPESELDAELGLEDDEAPEQQGPVAFS